MKKFIFLLILFGITYFAREPIYNFYRTYLMHENKNISLTASNAYSRDYSFDFVSLTNNFSPKSYQDLLNIYYTFLNSGEDSFSFYCPSDYDECLEKVESIGNNQTTLSTINNFVHPFNSFKHLETSYDDYGKVTLKVEHIYTDDDISKITEKIKEVEKEIWTDQMSVNEKIKMAHNYIINTNKYDKERSDNNIVKYKSDNAYGTILEGYSLCGGYTDAMELFLEDLNVKSFKVSSINHVWNAIYLNNNWYHLDLTWDDPITKDGTDILEYSFFMITSAELNELEIEQHNYDKNIYLELAK